MAATVNKTVHHKLLDVLEVGSNTRQNFKKGTCMNIALWRDSSVLFMLYGSVHILSNVKEAKTKSMESSQFWYLLVFHMFAYKCTYWVNFLDSISVHRFVILSD